MIATGIEYDRLFPGLVPQYEEREAAAAGLYTWTEWRALESQERAAGVAYSRLRRMIEMHQSDAVNTELTRRQRQQQG